MDKKFCRICVLPESPPDITLNDSGVCNLCSGNMQNKKNNKNSPVLMETDLIKILSKYRDKNKYDCMLMCSGGKDSVMSLYYMKRRYKMNPLVYTFDHGFENSQAMKNVKNATRILKVDSLHYKSYEMRDVFKKILTKSPETSICHICAIWYIKNSFETAKRYKIPLIVAGWTKGQQYSSPTDDIRAYRSMSNVSKQFIKEHLHSDKKFKDFPMSVEEAIKKASGWNKIKMISPHWYLQWDSDEISDILTNELEWKASDKSYPEGSTNCLMNYASVFLALKHYGYTHYHIEMSKLIREGEMTRKEALEKLNIDFDEEFINDILKELDCSV